MNLKKSDTWKIQVTIANSFISSNFVSSTDNLLVKCINDNCTEEDIHLHFRLCTRFSSYFCSHCCNLDRESHCCNLDQEIIKLLNKRTNNYWFCPTCAKPALNAVWI